jgi:methanogenic corrinoid protein MtbC1
MELLDDVRDAIVVVDQDRAVGLVNEANEKGVDPNAILQEGIVAGMSILGEKFAKGEYFLLELSDGSKLATRLIDMVRPRLTAGVAPTKGTIVMTTVNGDLHEIGKTLVSLMLTAAGYEVHDLGCDQPTMTVIDRAKGVNADMIGLSSLMLTTMPSQMEVIRYLRDMRLRDNFKVIIGGGPTSLGWADHIGADGWAPDAIEVVKVVNRLFGKGG